MKSSPNQPLKEIEVEKANEEEPISETVKERLRRERSQGKLVDKPSESYVSKSEQTKILKKHLLEKLGKEKLDRLLVLLASKENDKSKADKIQDLVEGKKDILAMVHAYIYYNK
jgi:predicted aldo/keto reductase-like oxidoreductase